MATTTGKAARKRLGNRYACKRSTRAKNTERKFGELPVSEKKGNAQEWVRAHSGDFDEKEEE